MSSAHAASSTERDVLNIDTSLLEVSVVTERGRLKVESPTIPPNSLSGSIAAISELPSRKALHFKIGATEWESDLMPITTRSPGESGADEGSCALVGECNAFAAISVALDFKNRRRSCCRHSGEVTDELPSCNGLFIELFRFDECGDTLSKNPVVLAYFLSQLMDDDEEYEEA